MLIGSGRWDTDLKLYFKKMRDEKQKGFAYHINTDPPVGNYGSPGITYHLGLI